MRATPFICLPTALALFALTAPAQEDPNLEYATYLTTDGKSVRGAILQMEEERVQLRVSIEGGGRMDVWRNLKDFENASLFRLRQHALPENDLDASIALARWACDKDLVNEARHQLRQTVAMVKEVSPDEAKRNELTTKAVGIVEDLFRKLIEKGQIDDARSAMSNILIRYPDRLTDAQKEKLQEIIENGIEQRKAKREQEKATKLEKRVLEERERLVAPIRKLVDSGKAERKKGLMSSKSFGTADGHFQRAIQSFETAYKRSQSLVEKHANDLVLAAELKEVYEEMVGEWKSCLLSSASLDITRGRFNPAMSKVNRILAHIDGDPEAMAMRARIEVAANEWDIWRN